MTSALANQYVPDAVTPPGATLEDLLLERGMTQSKLATQMCRPKKTINEIIKGKAAITHETALQLERVLHVPAEFWVRREADYRAYLARKEEAEKLRGEVGWLRRLPVRAMIKLGWVESAIDRVEQLRKLLDFFCIASPAGFAKIEETHGILFRRSLKLKSEPFALAAWLRRGEIESARVETKSYEPERFRTALDLARGLTRLPPTRFQQELRRVCSDAGVVVLFVPELPKACVSGVARWVSHRPIIQLSVRHKTDDHLWFTFFHESAHILLHGRQEVFVDEERTLAESSAALRQPGAPEQPQKQPAKAS